MAQKPLYFALNLIAVASCSVSTIQAQNNSSHSAPADQLHKNDIEYGRLREEANTLLGSEKYAEARIPLEKLCKIHPEIPELHCSLGVAYQAMGKLEEACKQYQDALKLKPNYAKAAWNLANCYGLQGNIAEASRWFQKCIDDHPADPSLILSAKRTLETLKTCDVGIGNLTSDDYLNGVATHQWASNHIPITVFIETGSSVSHYRPEFESMLVDALNEWTRATHGRLAWVRTLDKSTADVVCHWQSLPDDSKGVGGEASWKAADEKHDAEHVTITLFTMRQDNEVKAVPLADSWIQGICLHEVGHAVGIKGHSSNRNDAMFYAYGFGAGPISHLSTRDQNTITRLYKDYSVKNSKQI